ncbi:hypothetical protein MYSTI_04897 [Myxococcus stipitatus DSM 14675]|uniref:Uncharacterized protein n=1 Tax=Myxococcus stipitatus (strain DSM 14675 / JCM 12634 / Mx s8) TaxID=1278073 RepID=L7UBB0_MYXSD|nr:hypothetical protein [Myxococcus stipitatus]AGC46186.1 hypothetical protein MYSTI_04897 [Myxococcus stipitatus DSM 14675]
MRVFTGHTGGVQDVALHKDGEHMVSAGRDGMLRLWSTKTGACILERRSPWPALRGVRLHPTASGSSTGDMTSAWS